MVAPAAAETAADPVRQARIDLAAAYRLAVRLGLHEGICNHLTLMTPGARDRFLLIPYGLHWSEVTASNLIEVDFDGNVTAGAGTAEDTAFFIHARIHKNVSHAACVLHTHQPYASALTQVHGVRLEPTIQSAMRFYGRIAYDELYNGLALDNAEGDRIAAGLQDKDVMLMANHGVVVVGPTLAQAFDALYYLERAAKAQIIAMSMGRPLNAISHNQATAVSNDINRFVAGSASVHFAALKRLLDRDEPDYAA